MHDVSTACVRGEYDLGIYQIIVRPHRFLLYVFQILVLLILCFTDLQVVRKKSEDVKLRLYSGAEARESTLIAHTK